MFSRKHIGLWMVAVSLNLVAGLAKAEPGLFYAKNAFQIDTKQIDSLIIDVQPQMAVSVRECLQCEPKVLLFSVDMAERFEWDIYTGLDNHLLVHHSAHYWVLISLTDNRHHSLISFDKVDANVRTELEALATQIKADLLAAVEQPSL